MSLRFLTALALAGAGFAQSNVQGPVILIIGAPGAGKTTQAEAVGKAYGLPVITAAQLIADNQEVFNKLRRTTITGIEPETDPVLNHLFEQRIEQPDAARGFITAGYPSVKDHADFVAGMVRAKRLPNPIVIQLDVPESEVRRRLAKDPKYANLDQLIKDYQRELGVVQLYFPDAQIHRIDGRPKADQVTRSIRAVLDKKVVAQ
jgi:adenylate kinase